MNINIVLKLSFILIYIISLCSCSTSDNPKKKLGEEIIKESCGTINNEYFQQGGGYSCECFTYYASKDLMENYTSKELRDIKNNSAQANILFNKLFQAHEQEIRNCIQATAGEKIRDYADFERKYTRLNKSETITMDKKPIIDKVSVGEKTTIKMEKEDGVYQIPTEIDGIPMRFIFDTGASIISISATEASFLYKQGKLREGDFIGTTQFTDATGGISEGTIIILRTVKIGNRVLNNIQASVVHNLQAPLLMGQSALQKFGKISIDYQKSEITFE